MRRKVPVVVRSSVPFLGNSVWFVCKAVLRLELPPDKAFRQMTLISLEQRYGAEVDEDRNRQQAHRCWRSIHDRNRETGTRRSGLRRA
jgi:hypothetical protein